MRSLSHKSNTAEYCIWSMQRETVTTGASKIVLPAHLSQFCFNRDWTTWYSACRPELSYGERLYGAPRGLGFDLRGVWQGDWPLKCFPPLPPLLPKNSLGGVFGEPCPNLGPNGGGGVENAHGGDGTILPVLSKAGGGLRKPAGRGPDPGRGCRKCGLCIALRYFPALLFKLDWQITLWGDAFKSFHEWFSLSTTKQVDPEQDRTATICTWMHSVKEGLVTAAYSHGVLSAHKRV